MNRPIYYKSYRSRKTEKFIIPNKPLKEIISQNHRVILDIGFGTGDSTVALKEMFSDFLVCGIESYRPGIKKLISEKIHVEYGDALNVIEKLESNSVTQIYMLFPDPWQKSKHRKRRLLNEYTFNIIDNILQNKGVFQFATDNINYAFEAKRMMSKILSKSIEFSKHRGSRPITKYELKGIQKKNFIFDLIYLKN